MSTAAHPFWPQEGSTWQHWSDLLLATQLAAARAGFTSIIRGWKPEQPSRLIIRCFLRLAKDDSVEQDTCTHTLVDAVMVAPPTPDSGWLVLKLRTEHLEAQRHPLHASRGGISTWLDVADPSTLCVKPGMVVRDPRALHTLEGTLRAHARRSGRFLSSDIERGSGAGYAITCMLGTQRCPFLVRLRAVAEEEGDELSQRSWKCIEVHQQHTCLSEAREPDEQMLVRMQFFGNLKFADGFIDQPIPRRATRRDLTLMTKIDQVIGPFPVREAGSAPLKDQLKAASKQATTTKTSMAASLSSPSPSSSLAFRSSHLAVTRLVSAVEAQYKINDIEVWKAERSDAEMRRLLELDPSDPLPSSHPTLAAATAKLEKLTSQLLVAIDARKKCKKRLRDEGGDVEAVLRELKKEEEEAEKRKKAVPPAKPAKKRAEKAKGGGTADEGKKVKKRRV